jgi:hypothetical protein
MTKKKPNYTQYMKRPTPLEMSPPSDSSHRPAQTSTVPKKACVTEADLPWGEVIIEFGPNDSAPLENGPCRTEPKWKHTASELFIPEGTIIPDVLDPQPLMGEKIVHLPAQEMKRAASQDTASSVVVPDVRLRLEPKVESTAFCEYEAPPPLGVMATAVALVAILFFLV